MQEKLKLLERLDVFDCEDPLICCYALSPPAEPLLVQGKLSLLERLDVFDGIQESACMREFTRYRVCETY